VDELKHGELVVVLVYAKREKKAGISAIDYFEITVL
jgi:hypothetical protein